LRFALDFSTLIFALILQVVKFLCKTVQSVVIFVQFLLKSAKNREKPSIFDLSIKSL